MRLVETFGSPRPVPSLAEHSATKKRTTLVKKDDDSWATVEMCEDLILMDQLDAKFEDLLGNSEGITITDEDQPPDSMGFHQ